MTEINSTGVNTVVTLIAIGLTVISWVINAIQWYNNKQLRGKITTLELIAYIDQFHNTYVKTCERIPRKSWYKGTQGAELMHDLSTVLSGYNRYRVLFSKEECINYDAYFDEANKVFASFFGENDAYKDKMITNLNGIDKGFQRKKIEIQGGYLGKI
jgi:hypothetical protein